MVKQKKVAVIGGGVSGLAAAKAFKDKGHLVSGFERGPDFGGVWELSRSYPDVQTQSSKDLYQFSDHPMPKDYPEWPKGPQVHAYLHAHANKHNLKPLFSFETNVKTMARRGDGEPGWALTLEVGGKSRSEDFDFVAICTGQFSNKNMVDHQGQDEFVKAGGQIMHSSEYTDPAIVEGKRVVVLGGSKSATDIAVNATNSGAKEVTLVCRSNVWRIPYRVAGINFKHLVFMRFQEAQYNAWGRSGLRKAVAAATRPLSWLSFRGLEIIVKLQLGLNKWGMVPDKRLEDVVSCSFPIVTPGFFEALGNGRINLARGTYERYNPGEVVLANGETAGCDVSILATGWQQSLPFLGEKYREKLVDPNGQYRLYRYAVNPDLPDMGFVGFNSSFCTVLSSEMIADWLVRYTDRQLAHQPSDEEMRENIDVMMRWRREERPAAQVYSGQCVAPFHFRHFDELLDDIGATERKQANPAAEYFSYPKASAFGAFLKSAPQYRAE